MSDRSKGGLLLAAVSSLFFAVSSLVAKLLPEIHPVQLGLYSFSGILLLSLPLIWSHRSHVFPKGFRVLLVSRSVIGTLFLVSSFYAVRYMPLGDAAVLFYTAPVFTIVLASLFLKEKARLADFVVIVAVMIGVVLVTQPPFIFHHTSPTASLPHYYLGIAFGMVTAITDAAGNIVLRELKTIHHSVVLFNYGLLSLLQLGVLSVALPGVWTVVPSTEKQFILGSVLTGTSSIECLLTTLALSLEHAGPVALIQASDIIYGYILEVIFFGEEVTAMTVSGAAVVACAIVYTAVRRKPDDSDPDPKHTNITA